MPWGPQDAKRHTHLADTPSKQRQWAHVANGVLKETGDEGRAVREANATVHRNHGKTGPGTRKLMGH